MVLAWEQVRSGGSRISFQCWVSLSRGRPSKLEYKTTLSLEGLPKEAWDPDTVNLVLAVVDDELIDMLLAIDKWVLPCTGWLHNRSVIPKVLYLCSGSYSAALDARLQRRECSFTTVPELFN